MQFTLKDNGKKRKQYVEKGQFATLNVIFIKQAGCQQRKIGAKVQDMATLLNSPNLVNHVFARI